LLVAMLLALVVHLELLLTGMLPAFWDFWNRLLPRPPLEQPTEVQLVKLSPAQWRENRQVRNRARVEQERQDNPAARRQEPEPEKDIKGQVVDVAPTPDRRPPERSRFLSEHNTRVERESISRHQRRDYAVAQPRPTVAADQVRRRQSDEREERRSLALVTRRQGARGASSSQRAFKLELPDIPRRQSLKLKLDLSHGTLATMSASDPLRGNSDKLRLQLGKPNAEDKQQGDQGQDDKTVALMQRPSLKNLDMVSGAPANDHVEDVPKGEETLLNSREFKYATFFNRVKRGVSEHWRPGEVYLRHDPYGNVYGVKDRYTLVHVELDSRGQLDDISVVRSSGIDFLDDEAIHAFQGASPFPNPPQGLVEPDGKIRFQFGFYFEIGERPRIRAFKMQRYPF